MNHGVYLYILKVDFLMMLFYIFPQIGHEPLPPVQVTTWFGKNKLCYPSVIKYSKYCLVF